MKLTESINPKFTIELNGKEDLRKDYNFYREYNRSLSGTEILQKIYANCDKPKANCEIDLGRGLYDVWNTLHATLNLTEDQFIALAREELGLGEDLADGLHGMFDFAKVPPENH